MKSDRIKSWPKKERPRERLIAEGAEQLTDAELLAIILRVGRGTFKKGVAGQSALAQARELLVNMKGLQGLDKAHISTLLKVGGLSDAKVSQIKAAFEIGKRLQSNAVKPRSFDSSTEVAAYFRPRLAGNRHETVIALFLNGQNKLLEEKIISEGTPTQTTVYVRRVLEEALRASAAAIVLVHNHPSGSPEPSEQDDETTWELEKGASLIGLVLIDHIVVGDNAYYSYADMGRLQEFQK